MEVIHSIYSDDRKKRVVFYANADGTVGFCEERWSDVPEELCWIPGRWPDSRCDDLDRAIAEATGRVAWLAKDHP